MNEIIFLIEESLEGGYEAKALESAIHTEADNIDELKVAIRDAVTCPFDDGDVPRSIRLHFVKEEFMNL